MANMGPTPYLRRQIERAGLSDLCPWDEMLRVEVVRRYKTEIDNIAIANESKRREVRRQIWRTGDGVSTVGGPASRYQ